MERLETESPPFHERSGSFRNFRRSTTGSISSHISQQQLTGDDVDGSVNEQYLTGSYEYMEQEYDELAMLQAQVFLEDAVKFRSIHHKIDRTSLKMYRLYFSRPYQWFLFSVMFILLILAFFETPSSLTTGWTSDIRKTGERLNPPCGLTEGIEIVCLLVFVGDVILKSYFKGKEVLTSPWVIVYICVLAISLVDWCVSMAFICQEIVRVRRFIRPFFILQNSSLMKKTVNCLKKTMPEIISILFLLILLVYFFVLLGMLIFARPENIPPTPINPNGTVTVKPDTNVSGNSSEQYFDTQLEPFLKNLLVLLTTANHPDVMMPLFNENRFYALYFIVFLIFGLYCLMNMLTAVIYNQFRGYFMDSMQSSHLRRCVGIRAAFEVLHTSERARQRYGLPVPLARHTIMGAHIAKSTKQEMIRELDLRIGDRLTQADFHAICIVMEREKKGKTNKPQMVFSQNTFLNIVQTLVTHRYFTYFGLLLTFVNVVLISVELSRHYYIIIHTPNTILEVVNFVFIIYYTVEQSLMLWATGWRVYTYHARHIFDGVITVILVLLEVVYLLIFGIPTIDKISEAVIYRDNITLWDLIRVINIFIIMRLFRIIPEFKSMSLVVSTIADLCVNLQAFAGILMVIYYFFAILGMELFAQTLDPSVLEPMASKCGTYAQLNYWGNNFDDFAAALIVLWDVMVVNNWFVFLDAYTKATGTRWAQLYFVIWWLISVVISLNLLSALILENFIMKWEKNQVRWRASDQERSRTSSVNSMSFRATVSSPLSVHAMFRDNIQDPEEEEMLQIIHAHRYLRLNNEIIQ